MDFAVMKWRELQALCKRHGLAGGGSNADLTTWLAATLSGCGLAEEQAVGVVVGKGCLKRPAGGASGCRGSDAPSDVVADCCQDKGEAEGRGDAIYTAMKKLGFVFHGSICEQRLQ